MEFKDKLKEIRHNRGKTQDQAAKFLGIPRVNLNAYEQGYAEPGLKTLKKIIDKYDITDIYKFLFK